jgi:hypothetical protein
MLALLVACAGGPNDATLVDELRVVAAVADAPEIGPGEQTELTAWIADPGDVQPEVAIWTCTFAGDGCLETGTALSEWVAQPALVDGQVTASVTASPALAELLTGPEELPMSVWMLACDPGLCPLFDALDAAPGTDAYDDAVDQLTSPLDWLSDLPKEGVSLATKSVAVSAREPDLRNQNPTLQVDVMVLQDGSAELTPTIDDVDAGPDAAVWGLATSGGFEQTSTAWDEDPMLWVEAMDEADTPSPEWWVIATDALGGSAVWTGTMADAR